MNEYKNYFSLNWFVSFFHLKLIWCYVAFMMLEDSSSILSTSVARTSIASTTNEWSDQDNHSNCLDDNMDYNQE